MMKSTVFVTGANGFIGRALCKALRARGFLVRGLARNERAGKASLSGLSLFCGDICSPSSYRSYLEGVDTVVHLAGRAHREDDDQIPSQVLHQKVNVEATERLAKEAIAAGVKRFVFVSSISVYGSRLATGEVVTEATPPDPISVYGKSKLEAELILKRLCQCGELELVIVRPALVVGSGAPGNLARLRDLVMSRMPVPLPVKENRRSYVSLETLVDILVETVRSPALVGQVVVAADAERLSTHQIINWISAGAGKRSIYPRLPGGLLRAVLSLLGKGDLYQKVFGNLLVDGAKAEALIGSFPKGRLKSAFLRLGADS